MNKFSMYKFVSSTDQDILDSVKRFHKENKHYPSYKELNDCDYTPTARTVIRRFGSLAEFRKKFDLGSPDQRTGLSAQNKREGTMRKRIEILKYLSSLGIEPVKGKFSCKGKKYLISFNSFLKVRGVILIDSIDAFKKEN